MQKTGRTYDKRKVVVKNMEFHLLLRLQAGIIKATSLRMDSDLQMYQLHMGIT